MAEITIHNLDDRVHEPRRERVALHQRPFGAEARRPTLDWVRRVDGSAIAREAEAIRRSLEGRYKGKGGGRSRRRGVTHVRPPMSFAAAGARRTRAKLVASPASGC